MKAWIKGGLIGGVVGGVLFLLLWKFLVKLAMNGFEIIEILIYPAFNSGFAIIVLLFEGFVLGAILGALLGWIVGKIRNRE